MEIRGIYYDSPCGRLFVASTGDGLCMCDWADCRCFDKNRRRVERFLRTEIKMGASDITNEAIRQLRQYFEGERQRFDVPLLLCGSEFQRGVWECLLTVGYGETKAYADVAVEIGNPRGVRAVAGAIAANAISIFVPCHRIIGKDGSLTGFAGGMVAKRLLLGLEMANTD